VPAVSTKVLKPLNSALAKGEINDAKVAPLSHRCS
jgi:hypothetical protein